MTTVKFKLLSDTAKLPKIGAAGDVGFDLYASREQRVYRGETLLVHTDLQVPDMEVGGATYCRIEGRSGMALKGVFPVGGIIDQNYRGEIGVVLFNSNPHSDFNVEPGDRIAQLVFYKVDTADDVDFQVVKEIIESERGADGFGSSGK